MQYDRFMYDIPRVGVGIIVLKKVDGKQYIMLHQRKGTLGPGYWGSGGGHLELGESLMEGALRELREEAGEDLVVDDVQFMGVMNFTEMQPKHFVDVSFVARWVSGEPTNNAPRETTDWQWVPIDSLPEPLFPPVKIYLEGLQKGQVFHDSSFAHAELATS